MKNPISSFFLSVGTVCTLGFALAFFLGEETDPLAHFLHQALPKSSLSADFLVEDIGAYSGPVSESLESCINEYTQVATSSFIYTSVNESAVIDMNAEELKESITPVFGHAVRNNEISWKYDKETKSYIFEGAKGDEVLWLCYFKNENSFFSEFFISSDITLDFPLYGHAFLTYSSEESGRKMRVLKNESETIPLGSFFIQTKNGSNEKDTSKASPLSLSLSSFSQDTSLEVFTNSSAEVMRSDEWNGFYIGAYKEEDSQDSLLQYLTNIDIIYNLNEAAVSSGEGRRSPLIEGSIIATFSTLPTVQKQGVENAETVSTERSDIFFWGIDTEKIDIAISSEEGSRLPITAKNNILLSRAYTIETVDQVPDVIPEEMHAAPAEDPQENNENTIETSPL